MHLLRMICTVLDLPFLAYLPSLENKGSMYWLMKERKQLFHADLITGYSVLLIFPKFSQILENMIINEI